MSKICWKGRAFKALSFGKSYKKAGRNFSGNITIFHRGGGSKKLLRRIDFQRKNVALGIIERIEYDPNRTARIALVRWSTTKLNHSDENSADASLPGSSLAVGRTKIKKGLGMKPPLRLDFSTDEYLGNSHDRHPNLLLRRTVVVPLKNQRRESMDFGTRCFIPTKARQRLAKLQQSSAWSRVNFLSRQLLSDSPTKTLRDFLRVSKSKQNAMPGSPPAKSTAKLVGHGISNLTKKDQRGYAKEDQKEGISVESRWESQPSDLQQNWDKAILPIQKKTQGCFSYILASDKLMPGDEIFNMGTTLMKKSSSKDPINNVEHLYQKNGISLPLWLAPIGSVLHNIELYPGGAGKLARAAGTSAQLVQKPTMQEFMKSKRPEEPALTGELAQEKEEAMSFFRHSSLCTIRLPSGQQQILDLRCRATIGCVSNIDHQARKLKKAGHSRWLGIRPVVRGVAMNPIDHPHGGGEGRTKGGRPSVSPWGKPAKRARRIKWSPKSNVSSK